ncbi:MAG: glycerol-3-phosphate 1-O-acyltransferase PlsY [Anaerotignaceae bacterium]
MFKLYSLLIGYFIGCIQSAYFVGKVMKVDIRKHGSGNLGTTNALRVLGKRAGAITFVCDILKAVIAFAICYNVFPDPLIAGVYAGFGTVFGHDFPFYLGFKGGKGAASMIGIIMSLLVVYSPVFLVTYGVGIVAVALTNTISAGSLTFAVAIPIISFILKAPLEMTGLLVILAGLSIYKHKENIKRLATGTENKFIKGKNKEA